MSPRRRVGLLWTMLYITCLLFGLVLAVLIGPGVANGLTFLYRGAFGIMMVLVVVILALTTWHLTRVLIVHGAAWRWVVLAVGVAAVIAVAIVSINAYSPDDSALQSLAVLFPSALGIGAAAAVTMYALVMVLASHNQTPLGRTAQAPHPQRQQRPGPPAR